MEIRPDIQLQAAIKSMIDVVIPAIDPENPLAQEQGQLVLTALQFVKSRLPLQYCYDRAEIARYLDFAHGLAKLGLDLDLVRERGSDILARAKAEPAEMEAMARELRAATSNAVSHLCNDLPASARAQLKELVMDHAKRELNWERAWLLSLGLDAAPSEVQPIEAFVAVARNNDMPEGSS